MRASTRAKIVRSALLVDFDNLNNEFGDNLSKRLENWLHWLEDGQFDPAGRPRKFLSRTIYWNDNNSEALRPLFERAGFKVEMCRAIRKEKASSADFEMTIDAAELRHDVKNLHEVVLLSFDSDFLSVLNHLLRHEIGVWGLVDGTNQPARLYRQLIGTVIERPDFEQGFKYQRAETKWWQKRRVPVPTLTAPPVDAARARGPHDLRAALDVVLKAAEANRSSRINRDFVRDALFEFPGFTDFGRDAWFGLKYYPALAEKFTQMTPRLRTETFDNGMKVLVYVGGKTKAA